MPRPDLDAYYLSLLPWVAARSTCARRRVAAILVDARGRVLSMGYNGVPSGFPHCTEVPCGGAADPPGDTHRCHALHAEQNAILTCHRLDLAATLYCSCSPCFTCAKMICNTGVQRVVVAEAYEGDPLGSELLAQRGIIVTVYHG